MAVPSNLAKTLLPFGALLMLVACGAQEEKTYEADVKDESGGEMVVTDADAPAIEDQNLPETPMTNVPPTSTATPVPTVTGTDSVSATATPVE